MFDDLSGDPLEQAKMDYDMHRKLTDSENANYTKVRRRENERPQNGKMHLVFHFEEKVLLTSI